MSTGTLAQVSDGDSVQPAAEWVTSSSSAAAGRLLVPAALLAFGLGVHAVWVKSPDPSHSLAETVLTTSAGGLMLLAGCIRAAWPGGQRLGLLMVWASIGMFLEDLQINPNPSVHAVGVALRLASIGPLAHVLLAFPRNRLADRPSRVVVGVAYVLSFVTGPLIALIPGVFDGANLLIGSPWSPPYLAEISAVPIGFVAAAILVRRWVRSSPIGRRALGPIVGLAAMATASSSAAGLADRTTSWYAAYVQTYRVTALLIPVALLVGDLTVQRARVRATQLFAALPQYPAHGPLELMLRRTLRDPTLELLVATPGGLMRSDGSLVAGSEPPGRRRARTAVCHLGVRIAELEHDVAVLSDRDLLNAVASGVALALGNARLAGDLRRAVDEAATRQKELITLSVTEKARLERDLHDGVQADLVAALVMLQMEREADAAGTTGGHLPRERLALAETCLAQALTDVRRLARGARPAALDQLGLVPALRLLVERMPVVVDVEAPGDVGWGDPVDTTLYFVAREALTNAVVHGAARTVRLRVGVEAGSAVVEVADDGDGGARIVPGVAWPGW